MGDMSSEPSMEEILSSIKRIIAEDSEVALSAPRPRRSVARPAFVEESSEEGEVLELTEAVTPEPQPEAPRKPQAEVADPVLVSDAVTQASRLSLAALSALIVKPDVPGSDSLEGLVREMLKPMVAEWLEGRLPDIVERLVAQEIRRITDRG